MARAWKIEQDFYTNRDKLFTEKRLFEDAMFPCPLVEEGCSNVWGRPSSFINNPVFLGHDSQPGAVQQGPMSCNSFPVVLDILQRRLNLWNYVVAQDQSFDRNYAGMFLFRFWRFGKMEPVVVDDVLPFDVVTKTFVLSTLTDAPDLWCVIMEKAYAKFLGGYERLKIVTLSQAITDILGCTVQLYTISSMESKYRLFKVLKSVFDFDNIAIAEVQICPAATEIFRPKYTPSLYIITSMQQEQGENGEIQWTITLRLPCIHHSEFTESSAVSVSPNTFSITLKEFTKIFEHLHIGIPRFPHLFSESLSHNWKTITISGKWGRCRQSDNETLPHAFARVLVNKPDSYGVNKLSTVCVSLMQCYNLPTAELIEMGLVIYGLTGTERLQKSVSNKIVLSQPVLKTEMCASQEITYNLCLEPGQYLIVPEMKNDCICRFRSRYLLTLYSVQPITLMNGGYQQYGDEFLSPVALSVSSNDVVVGQPIRVAAKITEFPALTRYTISVLLTLKRTSTLDPFETDIKVRMEFVELCQGLMDKEIFMWVYYYEYAKFPLQGEEFIARCSAFIHELSTVVNAYTMVTTVMPKVNIAIDKHVLTDMPTMVTAMLHNTLPLTIPSARFRVVCSYGSSSKWITSSKHHVPPFGTIWIICRLKATEPRCHTVRVYFLSDTFRRSAALSVQVEDSGSPLLDKCPSTTTQRLLRHYPNVRPENFHMISCCMKHSQVKFTPASNCISINSRSYAIDRAINPTQTTDEWPNEIFYCTPDRMRDVTPEAEFLTALLETESETQGLKKSYSSLLGNKSYV